MLILEELYLTKVSQHAFLTQKDQMEKKRKETWKEKMKDLGSESICKQDSRSMVEKDKDGQIAVFTLSERSDNLVSLIQKREEEY